MNKPLLIESDNTPKSFRKLFKDNIIHFHFANSKYNNLDKYISEDILGKLKKKNFDIIYIKDSLSLNYLELYGLVVAHHIRLSEELKNTRYIPIIILSDIDGYTLNKLSPLARILFTKNIFLSSNSKTTIETFNQKKFKQNHEFKFLNQLEIQAPEKSTNHNIANEWAIDRWAEFLKINDSEVINQNKEKIASMLYFKYLKAKYQIVNSSDKIISSKKKGKVLFIDDKADKGWNDILEQIFPKDKKIDYKALDYNFKDKKELNNYSYYLIDEKIKKVNPDVVVLDLRLIANDNNDETDIDDFIGIKILQRIHKINAGIQVIMLTATSKSTILDKLYDYKILGYIKKEHPNDISIDTISNINKFIKLVDKGLEKQYLKEVWKTSEDILELNLSKEINFEVKSVFEILDSSMGNKFNYAIFAIFKCIEIVTSLYIKEKDKKAYWRDNNTIVQNTRYYQYRKKEIITDLEHIKSENNKFYRGQGNISVENKIRAIMHNKLGLTSDDIHSQIKCIVCVRNYIIHQDKEYDDKDFCKKVIERKISKEQLIKWFEMLQTILQKIKK